MYQISEFSEISETPIQTLRYYDSLDLLTPKVTGEYNSYRYYTNEQLIKLKIIKKLKKMGFKLQEISGILNNYDETSLVKQKQLLKEEIDTNLKNIKNIEEIVSRMKEGKQDIKEQLINLINKEERRNIDMKEKYNVAKEQLLNCYKMYQDKNFDGCLETLEELKTEIFDITNEVDPFWLNSAGDLFAGVAVEVFKNNKLEDVTFLNIFNFEVNGKEIIDNLSEYVESLDKNSYSFISLSGVALAAKETKASIISVYRQKMKSYAMFDVKM